MDSTDIDVDSSVKSTKVTVTIFLGIRERKTVLCLPSDTKFVNHVTVSQKKASLLFERPPLHSPLHP